MRPTAFEQRTFDAVIPFLDFNSPDVLINKPKTLEVHSLGYRCE